MHERDTRKEVNKAPSRAVKLDQEHLYTETKKMDELYLDNIDEFVNDHNKIVSTMSDWVFVAVMFVV